jgi:hypothetical protein
MIRKPSSKFETPEALEGRGGGRGESTDKNYIEVEMRRSFPDTRTIQDTQTK